MSESASPDRPALSRPAKRQKTDADLRRQRKREADRMAQKNSRERRRSHIDHLENMINILRKENGNAVTCELMETVLQLRAENERLRRIINNAKSSLSLAACEDPSTTYYWSLPVCRRRFAYACYRSLTRGDAENNAYASRAMRENNSRRASTDAEDPSNRDLAPPQPGNQATKTALLDVKASTSNNLAHSGGLNRKDMFDYLGTQRSDNTNVFVQFTDSWMDKMAAGSDRRKCPDYFDPFTVLGPLATAMPSVVRPRMNSGRCPTWERSNRIYGQISDVSPAAASQALALSSAHYADMIFKAVINGWATLNSEERNNPIMRTLGDMDQVFSELDPASRAAFMYKSHMLLKVGFEIGTKRK